MHSLDADAVTRREHAQRLNRAVDRALLHADEQALTELLAAASGEDTTALCGRIARRATRLSRQDPLQGPVIIAARDRRVVEVYGRRAPRGWFSAWCDGSSTAGAGGKRAGIGVVLMDDRHRVVSEFGEPTDAPSPLAAEQAALQAALRAAVAQGAGRLRVHTDCPALIHLWQEQRGEGFPAGLRDAARRLRHLQLYLVPRRFNQIADRLARRAAG